MASKIKGSGFGPRPPPLLEYLQQILRGYSDGQILKELLQNAEDAGASEVYFLYDQREFGRDKLLHPGLAKFQGPAVYTFNDAKFTDGDWEAIQRPARSDKKEDVLKVGRFGIGFSSVYHLTDLPCIISGDKLAFIDPFEEYFKDGGRPVPGFQYNLQNVVGRDDCSHQLAPFLEAFRDKQNIGRDRCLNGTIFRFSLRTAPSELCNSVYTPIEVNQLLQAFRDDARVVLLFLRNVERIRVLKRESSSVTAAPFLDISLVSLNTAILRQNRSRFNEQLAQHKSNRGGTRSDIELLEHFNITCNDGHDGRWITAQKISLDSSEDIKTLSGSLNYLPWVGVAIPVSKEPMTSSKLVGRIFCFLPLPPGEESFSGLPVHVHGYFGVSDDRRSIKWPGKDQIQNDTARWNKLLVEDVLPGVYLKAVLEAIECCDEEGLGTASVYNALPDISGDLGHWQVMVEKFYKQLFQQRVMFTKASSTWHNLTDVIIIDKNFSDGVTPVIIKCLQLGGNQVVEDLPMHVLQAVKTFASHTKFVNGPTVLDNLRRHSLGSYSPAERKQLLIYLLQNRCTPAQLHDLEFLQMKDGAFRSVVANPSVDEQVFLSTPSCGANLLPHLSHRFLNTSLRRMLEDRGLIDRLPQIRHLDPDRVVQLLCQTLPKFWNRSSQTYTGNSLDWVWLKHVWKFVYHNRNLQSLHGLYILPITRQTTYPVKLRALQNPTKVVHTEPNTESSYPHLVQMLRRLHVTVSELPSFVISHPDLFNHGYACKFDGAGILSCLKNIGHIAIEKQSNKDKVTCCKFLENLSFLVRSQSLSTTMKTFLKKLKIYPAYSSAPRWDNTLVNLNSNIPIIDDLTNLPEGRLPLSVLFSSNSDVKYLLRVHLNVPQKRENDMVMSILNDAINSHHSSADKKSLISWIAKHYDRIKRISGANDLLRNIPFIRDGKDCERPVKDLFDPSNTRLRDLFDDAGRFPSAVFLNSNKWTEILPQIGYRNQCEIGTEELLEIADRIQCSENIKQARALSQFLSTREDLLTPDFVGHLRSISCIPCVTQRPSNYPKGIAFLGESSSRLMCTPSQIVKLDERNVQLAGSQVHFTDVPFLRALQERVQPSLQEVCNHLGMMTKSSLGPVEVSAMLHTVYQFLNSHSSDFSQCLPAEWIWVGHKFVATELVCRDNTEIDLQPFLHSLPREYREYHHLFSIVQGSADINTDYLLNVLCKVKEGLESPNSENKQSFVDLSIRILKRVMDTEEDLQILKGRLFVPTQDGHLLPPGEVTFCDSDWLSQHQNNDDGQHDIRFVDDQISVKMSSLLGVVPLKRRLVDADEITGFSQTGQYESITNRIKNILNDAGYQSKSIPKEMIQNAEDAGASEVRFLIDLRSNGNASRSLLDDGMESLQGPALWVYNDSVFSDEDLTNITKLASGTKDDDGSKIGQFGLGFNSVYHLTDVPSFITRHFVNFFDPHRRFLGAQIRDGGRGIRIDFKRKPSCLERFRDQFMPYEGVFGCTLLSDPSAVYNGTLFRLPLRTKEDAINSDICQDSWDESKLKQLISSLCDTSGQMMLFTENVRKISIHLLREGHVCAQILPLFAASKDTIGRNGGEPERFRRAVLDSIQNQSVVQLPDSLTDTELSYSWTPEGREYFEPSLANLQYTEKWVVAASTGYGESISIRRQFPRYKSMVPLGGVAWKRGNDILDGQAFCYLPLSVPHSHLPVHINASFALSDDRSRLWGSSESSLDSSAVIKGRWNNSLFRDVVLKAYLLLLQDVHSRGLYTSNDQAHCALWPDPHITSVNGEYGVLMKSFYMAAAGIGNKTANVFWHPERQEMLTIKEVAFVDGQIGRDGNMLRIVDDALRTWLGVHLVLLLPDHILEGFRESNCSDAIDGNTYSLSCFLSRVCLPNIDEFPDEQIDSILLFALDTGNNEVLEQLKNSKCIPTSAGVRSYKNPSDLFDPQAFGDLFSPEDGCCPSQQFLDSLNDRQKGALRDMGCLKVDMDWQTLLERAQTIEAIGLHDMDLAKRRSTAVLATLHKKLDSRNCSVESEAYRGEFMNTTFLFGKDNDGTEINNTPEDTYLPSEKPIIGTVRCIADHIPSRVASYLGLENKKPPAELVLEHLSNLKSHQPSDHRSQMLLKQSCFKTYRFLQSRHLNNAEVVRFLKREECFYLNKVFVPARKVSFRNESVPPYIFRVDSDLEEFKDLLTNSGVTDFLPIEYLIQTLRTIAEDHQDAPLQDDLQNGVISRILKPLAARIRSSPEELQESRHTGIFVPDVNGVMRESTKLSFCDVDWVDSDDILLCHRDLTSTQAITLGVKDVRHQLLERNSEAVYLGEEFGQREDLTSRLKRILTGYPCDESILKELIQNADDAGATKMHFVLDKTNYGGEKLLGSSMKEIQGPALLAYNDKQFTHDDIRGIQKLGEGSKSSQVHKTGRYGVGFNVVYHLTDCPMFLSGGEILCLMDPTLRYVPGASVKSPGRLYRGADTNIKRTFPDFYNCFSSLDETLPLAEGTLFRLPLRKKPSVISSEIWSSSSLQSWFKDLQNQSFDVLLFLKSVQEISFSVKEDGGVLGGTYTVKSHIPVDDRKQRDDFVRALHGYSRTPLADIPVEDFSSTLTISDTKGYQEEWIVCQRVGLNDKHIPQSIRELVQSNRIEMNLLPKGGVATRLPAVRRESKRRDAERGNERAVRHAVFCFLPLPLQTPFRVHIDGYFALDHESRRNLWTGPSGDPMNDWNELIQREVIAPAFLQLLLTLKSRLNEVPMDRNAFLALLDHYHSLFPACDYVEGEAANQWNILPESLYLQICRGEHTVFPVRPPSYIEMQSEIHPGVDWYSCVGGAKKGGYFENLPDEIGHKTEKRDVRTSPEWEILQQTLLILAFPLLAMPFEIHTYIQNAVKMHGKLWQQTGFGEKQDFEILKLSPEVVLGFLRDTARNTSLQLLPRSLGETPIKDTNNLIVLIKYVKKIQHFESKLDMVPLLLTSDSQLAVFRESSKTFHSKFAELLPNCGKQFLHRSLLDLFDVESKEVFTEFTIDDLGSKLETFIDVSRFCTEDLVQWHPSNPQTVLTMRWLRKFWSFVSVQRDSHGKKNFVQHVLQHLGRWALLPVVVSDASDGITSRNKMHLFPLGKGTSILDSQYSLDDKNMHSLLLALGCPVLNTGVVENRDQSVVTGSYHDDKLITTLRSFVGHIEDCGNVLSVLGRLMNCSLELSTLTKDQCRCILRYFLGRIESLKKDDTKASILRELPCYETIDGRYVPLTKRSLVITAVGIPKEDDEKWINRTDCLFLKDDAIPRELHGILGVRAIDETKLYAEFILPCFSEFSDGGMWAHLNKLKQMVASSSSQEKLIEQLGLKRISLFRNETCELKKASDLYDPRVPVLRIMLTDHEFPKRPPGEMLQFSWHSYLEFLEVLGLQRNVSPRQFLSFAEALRDDNTGNEVEYERRKLQKDETLFEHFCKNHDLHTSREVLSKLPAIAFVQSRPVPTKHQKLSKPPEPAKVTLSAAPYSQRNLVWTTELLCPPWVTKSHRCPSDQRKPPCASSIEKQIGIKHMPDVHQVLQHVQTLCNTMGNQSDVGLRSIARYPDLLCEVLLNIFEFLSRQCDKCRDKDRSRFLINKTCADVTDSCENCQMISSKLDSVPVVPVDGGKWLILAKMVTKTWDEKENSSMGRYLKKLPDEFVSVFTLLQCLGATEVPTITQYADVLREISRSNDVTADPNLVAAATQAMSCFLRCLACQQNEPSTIEALNNLQSLHLMSQSKENPLPLSRDLYYNDKPQFNKRLSKFPQLLLKEINQNDIGTTATNIDDLIECLPEHLRPHFISSYVQERMHSSLDEVLLHDCRCSISSQLGRVLEWDQFSSAIRCIVAHDMKKSDKETIDGAMEKLMSTRFSVRCVKRLETQLLFEDDVIPDSHGPTPCMLRERDLPDNEYEVTVYVSHEASGNILYYQLAKKLRDHFKLINDNSHLVLILRAESEEDLANLLEEVGIGSAGLEQEGVWKLPPIGKDIPRDVKALLNQDPMFIFQEGEYVGYDAGDGDEELLIYAKVIESIDGNDRSMEPWQIRFRINIGEDIITVPGRKLFKFATSSSQPSQPPPDPDRMALELFSGTETSSTSANDTFVREFEGLSLEEVKVKVSQTLEEIRKLPSADKKKMLRRLMLKWHPDKHTVDKEFAEEIFKHIQRTIDAWENGREYNGGGFYEDVGRRARRDQEERQRWEERYRNSNAYRSRGERRSHNNTNRPPPSFHNMTDTLGAKRNLRQAKVDHAVSSGIDSSDLRWQWKCQLFFFAAEKAVRAAQLVSGQGGTAVGGLVAAAEGLRDVLDLTDDVDRLIRMVEKDSHYPNSCSSGRIPQECFTESDVQETERLSARIIAKVENFISQREV